jgi:hypothetical protein
MTHDRHLKGILMNHNDMRVEDEVNIVVSAVEKGELRPASKR